MTFVSDFFKEVPNTTICDWYYILYLVNLSVFVLLLLVFIYQFMFNSKTAMKVMGIKGFLMWLVSMGIALTSSLFFYLMCDRALLQSS